jgi:predicted RNA-binding protein with PUA-like domain
MRSICKQQLERCHLGKKCHLFVQILEEPNFFIQILATTMQYWLVKSEPTTYSWQQLVADGQTCWNGVRNYQARNNLNAMRKGDKLLFYHSVVNPAVVGIAQVQQEAYPDDTAQDKQWVTVDIMPLQELPQPVSLAQIKTEATLQNIALLRQPRLSVMQLSAEEFACILKMAIKVG